VLDSDQLSNFERAGQIYATKLVAAGLTNCEILIACNALLMALAGNGLAGHPALEPETAEAHRVKAKTPRPQLGSWANPTRAGLAGVEDVIRSR
jgi:hypothetical protein